MITITRMWPGGPLREFTTERPHSHWGTAYSSKGAEGSGLEGFAGSYVCDHCGQVTPAGLYQLADAQRWGFWQGKWVCATCREQIRKLANPGSPERHEIAGVASETRMDGGAEGSPGSTD